MAQELSAPVVPARFHTAASSRAHSTAWRIGRRAATVQSARSGPRELTTGQWSSATYTAQRARTSRHSVLGNRRRAAGGRFTAQVSATPGGSRPDQPAGTRSLPSSRLTAVMASAITPSYTPAGTRSTPRRARARTVALRIAAA
ncbi:hypothetical protein AN217_22360 [Streptomyces qinglanensis]|uniref:Uncharacterized protein n=1 Tax=Streptomyces qinglanensis TaxID=943816 RepID=A0A1E7K8D3_9ACTN|nr:hypothetical protein AN217_22360 [Streptomyces qinglanensis]OEV27157.1 hypothetical protein AN220_05860 [Streptomyces nanshensis]